MTSLSLVIFHKCSFLRWCLWFFIAMLNHKQLGEERVHFISQFSGHPPLLSVVGQDPEGSSGCRAHGKMLLNGLLGLLFYTPQDYHLRGGTTHQTPIRKRPYSLAYRPTFCIFLIDGLSFYKKSSLCQVHIKTHQHRVLYQKQKTILWIFSEKHSQTVSSQLWFILF